MTKVSFKVVNSLNILGIGKGYTQDKEGTILILRYRKAAAYVFSVIYIYIYIYSVLAMEWGTKYEVLLRQ